VREAVRDLRRGGGPRAGGGIGGRQIRFAVADDRSNPATATELATALVAKRVPLILGPTSAEACGAIAPLVTMGPLLYCLSPDVRPAPNSFVFSAGFSPRDLMLVAVRYLRQRGLTRIAFVTTSAAREATRAIDEALALGENRSMTLVARETLDAPGSTIAERMARVEASGSQATIAWVTGSQFGTFVRAASDAGLAMPILTSNVNLSHTLMRQYATARPSELLFPAGPSFATDDITDKATRELVETYIAEFSQQGIRPDIGQSLIWDPAQLIIAALRQIGITAGAPQLRTSIAAQRSGTGINGSYSFRSIPQRGLGPNGIVVVRFDSLNDTWTGMSKPGGKPN